MSRTLTKDLKTTLICAAVFSLLFYSQAFGAGIVTRQTLVVIDPGHNTNSPGLTAPSGLKENDLVMELAHRISGNLAKSCRTLLTQTAGQPAPVSERAAIANQEKADLFLSLHLHGTRTQQPLIYYFNRPEIAGTSNWQTRAAAHSKASRQLAEAAARSYKNDTPRTRPIILPGPMAPLEGIGMPGILVESFSLPQVPADPDKREEFVAHHARIISNAILSYLSGQDS